MPLAVLTFLVGAAYIPGLPSNAMVGRWTVFGIGAAILLWTIQDGKIVPRTFHGTPAHRMGAVLIAWILLGFAWCVSGWDHLGGLVQWAVMAMLFCIAAEQRSLDRCWQALALAVSISAGFALAQRYGFDQLWSVTPGYFPGLFLSRSMAGEIAVLALIGAIGTRTWWLVPGPLLQIGLASSRTVFLALGVAAFAWAWFASAPERRHGVFAAAALTAGALLVLAVDVFGMTGLTRLDDRLEIWRAGLSNLNPWGDGLGSFSIAFSGYEFAHNEFIHYAFELGAASVLIWGIALCAFTGERTLERTALAALLAQCSVYFPLHAPATAYLAALLAGFLVGVRGRALAAERDRRASCARGLYDAGALGIGAPSAADVGRGDLPFGPKPAVVA